MGDPDGRKVFVTHRKPHLDEVAAAWLLRTFDPSFRDCGFEYISYRPDGGGVPEGPAYVAVGVGRGKYDEHGRQSGHSACQLVYQDLLHRGLIPNDQYEERAIEWMVDYVHKEDTAQWKTTDPHYTSFSIPAILRGFALQHPDDPSQVMMDRGIEIIGAVVTQLNELAKFLRDWEQRIEFDSIWGKAVGVHSTYRGSDAFAYHHGYVLRVQTDPTKPFGDFRGPANSSVDLQPIYDKLNAEEPGSWYLHQSHKILVSNVDPKTTGLEPTRFSLQQLIDFVKKK